MTEVRRRVTVDTTGHRGTAKDPIWAKSTRLLRSYERLSPQTFTNLWNGLIEGGPSGQILTAWIAKEELKLLALAKTGGQRHDVAHRLFRFNNLGANSGVSELERLGARAARWDHWDLVARGAGLPSHRCDQRRDRSHQPDREDRSPHRLRLPQPRQSTPTSTVRLRQVPPPGERQLRVTSPSTSKSRHDGGSVWNTEVGAAGLGPSLA